MEGDPGTVGGPVGSVAGGDGLSTGAVGPYRFDAVFFFDAGEEGYLGAVGRPGGLAPGAVLEAGYVHEALGVGSVGPYRVDVVVGERVAVGEGAVPDEDDLAPAGREGGL